MCIDNYIGKIMVSTIEEYRGESILKYTQDTFEEYIKEEVLAEEVYSKNKYHIDEIYDNYVYCMGSTLESTRDIVNMVLATRAYVIITDIDIKEGTITDYTIKQINKMYS